MCIEYVDLRLSDFFKCVFWVVRTNVKNITFFARFKASIFEINNKGLIFFIKKAKTIQKKIHSKTLLVFKKQNEKRFVNSL